MYVVVHSFMELCKVYTPDYMGSCMWLYTVSGGCVRVTPQTTWVHVCGCTQLQGVVRLHGFMYVVVHSFRGLCKGYTPDYMGSCMWLYTASWSCVRFTPQTTWSCVRFTPQTTWVHVCGCTQFQGVV